MVCEISGSISVLYEYLDSRGGGGGIFLSCGQKESAYGGYQPSRYLGSIQLCKSNLFYFLEAHGCVVY